MVVAQTLRLVFAALLVVTIAGCSRDESPADVPADAASQPDAVATDAKPVYPRPILLVRPSPGEELCLPSSMEVRFKLNDSMILNGRYNEVAFNLIVDGRNVMREVEFFPSQSFPHTHVAVLYAMWVYDPGPHTARVEFIGDDGDTHYEWSFTVKEGCPKPLS